MRRAGCSFAVVCALLPACSTQERPEGIVERWLLALNQASAGDPDRYAVSAASEQVLPGWRTLEPGELDLIEVGRGSFRCEVFASCETRIPFRVIRLDGRELRMDAIIPTRIGPPRGGRRLVVELVEPQAALRLPSEGGPPFRSVAWIAWLSAFAAGLALLVLSEASMRLARRPPS